jgi:hypothetical protein
VKPGVPVKTGTLFEGKSSPGRNTKLVLPLSWWERMEVRGSFDKLTTPLSPKGEGN